MNTSRPTSAADSVRSSTYAGSVKFCIHVPMFEANNPSQIHRKSRYDNAARAVPGRCRCGRASVGADIDLTGRSRYPRVGADERSCRRRRRPAATGHRSHRIRSGAWETTAGTAKLTMAELTRAAAERHGDAEAARYLRDGAWETMTFAELWGRVADIGRGLIGLGVGVGDRVAVLCNTRLEFTLVDLAASSIGAIVVPVYPTNSPDECQWVVGDSGATVIVCETADHVAKIDSVRAALPALVHTIVVDGAGRRAPCRSPTSRPPAPGATTTSCSAGRPPSGPTTPA